MKNKALIYGLFLVMTGCGEFEGQQDNRLSAKQREDSVSTNKEIAQVVDSLHTALVNRDSEVLNNLCAQWLSYGHSSGTVQDKKTFIEDAVNGSFSFLYIRTEDEKIQRNSDLAIVRHTFLARGINKGDTVNIRIGNVMMFREDRSGHWHLLVRQAYKL